MHKPFAGLFMGESSFWSFGTPFVRPCFGQFKVLSVLNNSVGVRPTELVGSRIGHGGTPFARLGP